MLLGLLVLAERFPLSFAALVAQQSAPPVNTDPTSLTFWIQYGPIGVVLVLLMVGGLETRPGMKRMEQSLETVSKQRDDMIETYAGYVIPVLENLKPVPDLVSDITRAVSESNRENHDVHGQLLGALEKNTTAIRELTTEVARLAGAHGGPRDKSQWRQ